jgi:hypothetical protein
MDIVNPDSLSKTLDALNEAFFFLQPLTQLQKEQVAEWIASRQGKAGSYANMFAPTEIDFKEGARLFTGEIVPSRAATSHILGEEACRALILLDVKIDSARQALERASLGMIGRLGSTSGIYCCGKCTTALWRHLVVGGLNNSRHRLTTGLEALKARRDGEGRWRTFPFYYTLLALNEINSPLAIEEMKYASPVCERYLQRVSENDKTTQRRRVLLEKILEKYSSI